ncbi:hypothetical protein SISNIDRAFT_486155 [Sistotremastrum niveocremeum HHB9708]|uniref:Uncharacterized protein n=1 Tax=Sistotremastrum niveocremeum HHB9708 TaxID=1314777 RepID=A0A164TTV5_9AGAM|nr:hypothetical protein SISNIDRAFT_486155 [Sistotremastrum niveocremeum HHB9708]
MSMPSLALVFWFDWFILHPRNPGDSSHAQIYGYAVYQHRITLIRKRSAGHFDQILGPIIISICLFVAVLANFILRVREFEREARDSQP